MDLVQQHKCVDGTERDHQLDTAWRTHAPVAMRFATSIVGPADAHDVMATGFLRVRRQPGWTEIEHLDRYLMRAIRNEAQNLHRQRRRRWQRDLLAVLNRARTRSET